MSRTATHAGSWYSSSEKKLNRELDEWLAQVPKATDDGEPYPIQGARAIIAPHAGYSYSGPTAAFAYKCVNQLFIKRVFILGPSHHEYLPGCALSILKKYQTPLGDLTLDLEVIKALKKTGHFTEMTKRVDEDEHSIEMHLPYIYKIFEYNIKDIKIVPILVGGLSEERERFYGQLLADYLNDPSNLFIISSDFCHWGNRFEYTYYCAEPTSTPLNLSRSTTTSLTTPIYQSIHDVDHEGMRLIESLDYGAFQEYLQRTKNTICGRHPIGVLMCALQALRERDSAAERPEQRARFVRYAQSSQVKDVWESSVSYASAFVYLG